MRSCSDIGGSSHSAHRIFGIVERLRKGYFFPYLLLAPALIFLGLVILYPILSAMQLSFHEVDLFQVGAETTPVTLENFAKLLGSRALWEAGKVSLAYVVVSTVPALLIGMGTALLLNREFVGRSIARMLVFLPWAVPLVVATNIWWWLLDPSFGLVDWVLVRLHILSRPVNWLMEPWPALIAVCLVTIWKGYPFFTIWLLAGLQAIPADFYEAAKIDGAGAFACFRYITVPALRPVISLATLINALWTFREFTVIWVLTRGGPVRATETLAIWTYREAFGNYNMGFAAAIGMLTLAISVLGSIAFIRLSTEEFY